MTLRHQCATDGCYKDKLPDWGFLDGAFGGKIRPTDIDGLVELAAGFFLFLEAKGPHGTLRPAQRRAFGNLVHHNLEIRTQVFTVLVYGRNDDGSGWIEHTRNAAWVTRTDHADVQAEVRRLCELWTRWARAERLRLNA